MHIAGDAQDSLEAPHVHGNRECIDDTTSGLALVTLRPRFAGDGRLRLPADLRVLARATDYGKRGDVFGDFADAGYDPFARVASDLLLAEEFARVDLRDHKTAGPWYQEHGVLDLAHFFTEDAFDVSHHVREARGFYDALSDVLRQQANVRWHLTALARLSDERVRADPPLPGWAPHEGWDPAWAQPALRDPAGGVLWLGGSSSAAMRTAPDGVPVLWVPTSGWRDVWDDYDDGSLPSGRWSTGRLSADWWGLVELERRLLEPYVLRAAEFQVEVRRAGFERALSREGESMTDLFPAPLVVHERRWWSSLLAPVYLQLLEGLRRVTEGQRGAGLCRECGQPFLTLDARRSSFCTDRERFRFSQRERRKRLSAPARLDGPTEVGS
jgi:hypothetical protein